MDLRSALTEAPEIITKVHAFLNLRDNMRLLIYLRQEGLFKAFQTQDPRNVELVDQAFGKQEDAGEHGSQR